MAFEISRELDSFKRLMNLVPRERYSVLEAFENAFIIAPTGFGASKIGGKQIGATILAIVHGNEWAGLASVNSVLEHIISGTIQIRYPVAFALGNPQAAIQNKRFLERDLNRSFDRSQTDLLEEKRADQLESILAETAWLLDIHQTRELSAQAFFIFPFTESAFKFARSVGPAHPIVTHWGKPFSAEGRCTDEYVNRKGGTGITIELGRNSFDPYHISVGVDAILWTLRTAGELAGFDPLIQLNRESRSMGDIYTWAAVVPWPEEGEAVLEPGWFNFKEVNAGQLLGRVGKLEIKAPESGHILFPKYLDPKQDVGTPRPTELCRIMKKIQAADLPKA